ncbi:MAG: chitobiase/beta-hexosaminidase C-terminal domain-containing protein [Bacteroidales bacterium]|nr:chitobiase/beta-hexosaminidase C-terminal domain-containing protein [Bacteroidales bacterium]
MIKKLIYLLLLLTVFDVAYCQDLDEEIGEGTTFEYNKHYPRVNVVSYDNDRAAKALKYKESSAYKSLNGSWAFVLKKGEVLGRQDVNIDSMNIGAWSAINVPGRWETNGNKVKVLPLKNMLSVQSMENPVGLYFKEIEIGEEWKNQICYLYIGAARGAYTVWINGKYVGYSEDSKTPSEFDITPYLVWDKKGLKKNNVLIQLQSVSNGSLLESKIPLSLTGIERDVALYAKPICNISDYSIECDYIQATGAGKIEMTVSLENHKKKGEYYVEVMVLNDKGKEVDRMGKWAEFEKRFATDVNFARTLPKVEPWDEYNPNLYTIIIRLKNKNMETEEMMAAKVGFRNIDYSKGILVINGNKVKIRGVVYSDYTAMVGGFSEKNMRAELQMMKDNNINAVRIVYFPVHPIFYDLCDEYGIYVFNEANIQPYHFDRTLSTNKDYSSAFIGRVRNMYERDKNHPSIVAWSLGDANENGICFEDAYVFLRQKDKVRPIVFNGTETGTNTDFVFTKYKTMDDMFAFIQKRQLQSLIMSEYGSTQGNSFGGKTQEMWKQIRQNDILQGGFIAYWNDMEVYDANNGEDVKIQGIIDSKGVAKPYLSEIKKLYGFIEIEYVDKRKGRFKVKNNHEYKTLKDFRMEYMIYSNLKPTVVSGDIPLTTKSGESTDFELQIPQLKAYAGEEYFIRFSLKERNNTKVRKRGYEYDFVEFGLTMPTFRKQELKPYEKTELQMQEQNAVEKVDAIEVEELNIKNINNILQVFNEGMSFEFDINTGEIISLKYDGRNVFESSPKMNFGKRYTLNEIANKNLSPHWENIGLNNLTRVLQGVTYKQNDKYTVNIDVVTGYQNYQGVKLFDVMQTIVVYCTGDVLIDNEVVVTDLVRNIPRVGMAFELSKAFSDVQWFGYDSETYTDRKRGGKMGTHKAKLSDMVDLYEPKQSSGNRTDTRWMSVGGENIGIFFDAIDSTFDFSISLDDKANNSGNYIVNFDYKNVGVGNGEALPIDDDMLLKDRKYNFKVRFVAYENKNHSPFDFRMIKLPVIESNILSMPLISKDLKRFDSPMTITLSSVENAEIRYTLDGSEPTETSVLYKKPFVIDKSTEVKARSFKKGYTPSLVAKEQFNYNFIESINYENKPNTPYNKNMEKILFDGEFGVTDDLEKGWLGFSGSDFVAVVKLMRPIDLKNVAVAFAHTPENWVFAPKNVEIFVSADSITYSEPYTIPTVFKSEDEAQNVSQLVHSLIPINHSGVKYIKIVAHSIKKIPMWHEAKGLRPWIMIDEIQIIENNK